VSASERRERIGHRAAAILVKEGALRAYVIERELFDRGVVGAVVAGAEMVALATALVESGIVALCVGEAAELRAKLGPERVIVAGEDVDSLVESLKAV